MVQIRLTLSILHFSLVISCGEPPQVAHSAGASTGGNTYGSVRTYTCNSGHRIVGSSKIICKINKDWTEAPTCCKCSFLAEIIEILHHLLAQPYLLFCLVVLSTHLKLLSSSLWIFLCCPPKISKFNSNLEKKIVQVCLLFWTVIVAWKMLSWQEIG